MQKTATDLLKKQHREVLGLLKRAIKTDAPKAAKLLLTEISGHLQLHSKIEEEIFYPAVRQTGTSKAEDMILEALEEHHVVDLVLEELPDVDPAADSFVAKITVLKELIEHHAGEEEAEMFPLAEKKLGREQLVELAQKMEARADEITAEQGAEKAPSRKRAVAA